MRQPPSLLTIGDIPLPARPWISTSGPATSLRHGPNADHDDCSGYPTRMTVRCSLGAAARRAIELLSHNVVLRRRLPAELGGHTIYVAPDASLRFWVLEPYEVDPLLLALAREIVREGDAVWDTGANVGLFSIAAAHFARQQGRVVAVEPDPWLATLVRRSARRLPPTFAPIEVVEAAVSNSTGVASFAVAARARAASHL